MIKGLGCDIIEIKRIHAAIQEHGELFLRRIFTEAEQKYCSKFRDAERHYAGRFAAKEAIVKAVGTGIGRRISWLDMEIGNDEHGKPFVILSEKGRDSLGNPAIEITISHCKEYAMAVAVFV